MTLQDSGSRQNSGASIGPLTSEAIAQRAKQKPIVAQSVYEQTFNQLVQAIRHHLQSNPLGQSDQSLQTRTHFTLSLTGEQSQFTRFNRAKVRQSGEVCDGQLHLTLIATDRSEDGALTHRTTSTRLPFVGSFETDWALTQQSVSVLQQELPYLPADPYAVLPTKCDRPQTRESNKGQLLNAATVANTLLEPVQTADFSGLYAGGTAYRAYADSAGNQHWFEADSFTLDYSLFGTPTEGRSQQAAKGIVAGKRWNAREYASSIAAAQQQLALLERPVRKVPRGSYRTYLAPAAVADIIDTIIWGGGLGESSLRQGNSAFEKLATEQAILSDKFSLSENFQRIGVPRFNSSGEMAPLHLPIIHQGRWTNSLVNGRSAKEYGKPSNGANLDESMRAPVVSPGRLETADVLQALGTGLYVSNLHYLNWSDLNAGRITGMTRYACFWVEDGEMIAPIENLRFDDDLYRFLGEGLVALTQEQTFLPDVGTYDQRSLGGMWMPGMLIDQFRYTL